MYFLFKCLADKFGCSDCFLIFCNELMQHLYACPVSSLYVFFVFGYLLVARLRNDLYCVEWDVKL